MATVNYSIYIYIYDIIISSNRHSDGISLISLNNGEIYCSKSVITNNSYFETIVNMNLSHMVITDHLEITKDQARHILKITEVSYILIFHKCTFKITNNIVHSVLAREVVQYKTKPLCYFQLMALPNSLVSTTKDRDTE